MTDHNLRPTLRIFNETCQDTMRRIPTGFVNCIVTSPPYWALRLYEEGARGLGRERNPQDYINNLCDIMDEAKRVLRDDGSLWLNIGDTRNASRYDEAHGQEDGRIDQHHAQIPKEWGIREGAMVGIPFRVAFEMQKRGWMLRSFFPWIKVNPSPTRQHAARPADGLEYIFYFTKNMDNYWDHPAVRGESPVEGCSRRWRESDWWTRSLGMVLDQTGEYPLGVYVLKASGRSVHNARYPLDLISPMIELGCPQYVCRKCRTPWKRSFYMERISASNTEPVSLGWHQECSCQAGATTAVVYDMFGGSGTTQHAALASGRSAIYSDVSKIYCDEAKGRLEAVIQGKEPPVIAPKVEKKKMERRPKEDKALNWKPVEQPQPKQEVPKWEPPPLPPVWGTLNLFGEKK